MTSRVLDVWLYGTRIATVAGSNPDRPELTWSDSALDRWGHGARLLSFKLPMGERIAPPLVRSYLDGLLPEGNARINHAISAGVAPDDTFALMSAYGRDTAGAAIFVDQGEPDPSRAGRYVPITLEDVADRLRRADEHSPASEFAATGESSTLPGMIPKITLHRDGNQWYACKDGAASTWIIKRGATPASPTSDVIDTEVACLAIARWIDLTTVDAEILELGDVRAIAVSRYDRIHEQDPRLHQEDLAQAIGLNTQDPNRKFQWGSSMPSLKHAADVLRFDGRPDKLLQLVTFSHLVGNTDMHAKNISFLRDRHGAGSLSPAYDIAMHLHHRRDNRRFALDVNGKADVSTITADDLIEEGRSWGLPARRSRSVVGDTVAAIDETLRDLDRDGYPGVSDKAWAVVEDRVQAARRAIPGVATRLRSKTSTAQRTAKSTATSGSSTPKGQQPSSADFPQS